MSVLQAFDDSDTFRRCHVNYFDRRRIANQIVWRIWATTTTFRGRRRKSGKGCEDASSSSSSSSSHKVSSLKCGCYAMQSTLS